MIEWACTSGYLLVLSTVTIRHIYLGSKSTFAYTLASFTLLMSLQYGITGTLLLLHENKAQITSTYTLSTYTYFLVQLLQNWIFAFQYLKSAIFSSYNPVMTLNQADWLRTTGIVIYVTLLIVCYVLAVVVTTQKLVLDFTWFAQLVWTLFSLFATMISLYGIFKLH